MVGIQPSAPSGILTGGPVGAVEITELDVTIQTPTSGGIVCGVCKVVWDNGKSGGPGFATQSVGSPNDAERDNWLFIETVPSFVGGTFTAGVLTGTVEVVTKRWQGKVTVHEGEALILVILTGNSCFAEPYCRWRQRRAF
jgi:hypothetical protein